jgi:hypothetical protein
MHDYPYSQLYSGFQLLAQMTCAWLRRGFLLDGFIFQLAGWWGLQTAIMSLFLLAR